MSRENILKLKCSECNNINYWSKKNKKKIKEKVDLNKHCSTCKKHTLHKEMKK